MVDEGEDAAIGLEVTLQMAWDDVGILEDLVLGNPISDDGMKAIQQMAQEEGFTDLTRYFLHSIKMEVGEAFLMVADANDERKGN